MADAPTKPNVVFLCTGNSCRSQMAEGWARHLHGDVLSAYSAGTRPQRLNPLAVRAMSEVGVDISRHVAKSIDSLGGVRFALAVTVCDSANEECPVFPGARRTIHRAFEDPPRLASNARTDDEAMTHYRRVRDEIGGFAATLPALLADSPPTRK